MIGRDLEAARLDLVRDVRSDFALALATQRRLALADETLAIAREVAATAQRKVEAGALPAVEATRARVAISAAEIETERARGHVQIAIERLALNWGGSPLPEQVEGDLDSLTTVPTFDSLVVNLAGNPDLARWTNLMEYYRARLRFEQSLKSPDLNVGEAIDDSPPMTTAHCCSVSRSTFRSRTRTRDPCERHRPTPADPCSNSSRRAACWSAISVSTPPGFESLRERCADCG